MMFGKTKASIVDIKIGLKRDFSIKELGDLKYCLGIEIHRKRNERTILMNQQAYIR